LINLNQKVNKGFSLERQYFKYLDERIDVPEQKYAREKDILINSLGQGTLGRVHYFCEKARNIVVDQHLFILRINEKKVTSTFLYLLLTSKAYQIQIDRQITGSTGMLMLNASNLKEINIIIPKLEVMQQFEENVYTFFEMVVVNELENQKLTELRDWLLPMLMNGQVKVKEFK
jgi:type I restriction enzyme S subunit